MPAAGVPAVDVFAGAVCSVPLRSVSLCSVSLRSVSPPGRAPAPAEVPAVVTRAAVTTLSIPVLWQTGAGWGLPVPMGACAARSPRAQEHGALRQGVLFK